MASTSSLSWQAFKQWRAKQSRGGEADRLDALKQELAQNKTAAERLLDAVEKGLIPSRRDLTGSRAQVEGAPA